MIELTIAGIILSVLFAFFVIGQGKRDGYEDDLVLWIVALFVGAGLYVAFVLLIIGLGNLLI